MNNVKFGKIFRIVGWVHIQILWVKMDGYQEMEWVDLLNVEVLKIKI